MESSELVVLLFVTVDDPSLIENATDVILASVMDDNNTSGGDLEIYVTTIQPGCE